MSYTNAVLLIGMGMGLGLKVGLPRNKSCQSFDTDSVGQGMSYTNAVEQSLEEGTFISNSLDRLRNDDRALFLIGFPICNLSIDYRDEKNTFTNEEEAKILVPVSGPSGEVPNTCEQHTKVIILNIETSKSIAKTK